MGRASDKFVEVLAVRKMIVTGDDITGDRQGVSFLDRMERVSRKSKKKDGRKKVGKDTDGGPIPGKVDVTKCPRCHGKMSEVKLDKTASPSPYCPKCRVVLPV